MDDENELDEELEQNGLYEHYDDEIGYTHLADYCMIAPDEETLFCSHNDITGSGS